MHVTTVTTVPSPAVFMCCVLRGLTGRALMALRRTVPPVTSPSAPAAVVKMPPAPTATLSSHSSAVGLWVATETNLTV